jgi:hypothetical protein
MERLLVDKEPRRSHEKRASGRKMRRSGSSKPLSVERKQLSLDKKLLPVEWELHSDDNKPLAVARTLPSGD